MSTPEVDMSDYESLGCLHDLFINQARKSANKVAVVNCDGTKTTFEELDKMSDLLANKLQRLGLGKNKIGGILMERSLEYVVSYIGILKTGGAYLPVEVSWPVPLLNSVLTDAEPSVIITKQAFFDRVKQSGIPIVHLNGGWLEKLVSEQKAFPLIPLVGTSLDEKAYLVYSSGTTGKPKGIECPHRGSVYSFTWRHRAYPYCNDDREACNVFFVWEMLRPLAQGIPMYIIPDDVIYDPPQLADFIRKNHITRMLFTPSLLQAVLEYKGINLPLSFQSVRLIIYCGEVLTTALKDEVAKRMPWIQQLNLYSISECHDISNADLTNWEQGWNRQFCPVGKLLPRVHAVIMDQQLNVKSVGEPGEIYIGGPCLAIGYLNRPEMNRERFIRRPEHVCESVGDRLYRTGDWGYVLSDGSLEVCGRCDTMVKIRGYTIELEAVRVNLLELQGVVDVFVKAVGNEGEDKTLVAFIVPKKDIFLFTRDLCCQLKKRLPFYMIPSRFIVVQRLPMVKATGKLDVKQLELMYKDVLSNTGELEVTKLIDDRKHPVSQTEREIAAVWSQLLQVYSLDTEESFFELGGHSLLAAALTSQLNEQFGSSLSTSHVFQHPTISSLASLVTTSSTTKPIVKINLKKELDKLLIPFNEVDRLIRSYWQTVQINPNRFSTGNVLLTGATGYVGCFLLQELLHKTHTTIYCLVRESPDKSPRERLEQARLQFGLRKFLPGDRVIPIKGDVSLTNLGLSKDIYSALSLEVDVVIHAAAHVNLVLPFSALYNANVIGTYNIIVFSINGKIKHIHHISTTSVFPAGAGHVKEDTDMGQYCERLHSGYGQTKWMAEQLVWAAANRGCPTTIYRCGNVGGSPAGWNPEDFNFYMLKGVIKTGLSPDIKNWKIEFTPVDFLSQIVIHLVLSVSDSINKVFHLVNSSALDWNNLAPLLNDLKYNIKQVSYEEWKSQVVGQSKAADGQLTQLGHLLDSPHTDDEFSAPPSNFCQENLNRVLNKKNLVYPSVDMDLLKWHLEQLSSVGLLPKPKQNRGGLKSERSQLSLKGKIALVTGASSGIGEGISRTLASAGATVVLAARRLDRLTQVAKELAEEGLIAVPLQLDVCNEQDVVRCIQHIENTVGPIDVLVNNAGVMYYQHLRKCDLESWNQMVSVNVNGVLNCVAAVLPKMVARCAGHVVNISSDGARKPFAGLAVYCGTKYFVRCLSGAMRSELVTYGIRVTDIQPGDVESELHKIVRDPEAELMYDWSTKVTILKPSEVGEAVLFALSQPAHCAINEIMLEPQSLPLY